MITGGSAGDAFYGALVEDDPEELYDRAPCAYLSTLPDGTIAKVNGTFLAWTGFAREELVGQRRFQQLFAPGDRMFYETHIAPALRLQGHVREIAVDILCEGGRRLPVLVNSILKYAEDGSPGLIRVALFDATERRAYERELVAAMRRAEASEARARALARTLQASFLPPEILTVPDLDVGGAFRPAGDGTEVGGDFYDVFETGRGSWGVVLGDVCGKGASAAVLTALARYTVRAEALRSDSPSDVLRSLHHALVRYHPDQFATALFLVVECKERRLHLRLASGGHHLPVRRHIDGTFDTVGVRGAIVGLLETTSLTDAHVALEPGDVIVLYTDGVTEARRQDEFFGDDRLCEVIARAAGASAQDIADAIVADAVAFQDGDTRDDIAVVVLRVPEPQGAP